MKTIPAYPLQWPTGWDRTPAGHRTDGKFGKRDAGRMLRDVTINDAVGRVREQLRMLGIHSDDVVVSTNLTLRLDGWPRSEQAQPSDTGVAVYWIDQGGNPKLVDGPHSERDGAEEAATLLRRLGLAGARTFAVAEVRITALTGQHGPLNEEALGTLNAIGLRPHG